MCPSSDHFNPRNCSRGLPSSVHLRAQGEQDAQAVGLLWPPLCPLHVHQPLLEGLQGVHRFRMHSLRGTALLLGPMLDQGAARSQPSGF